MLCTDTNNTVRALLTDTPYKRGRVFREQLQIVYKPNPLNIGHLLIADKMSATGGVRYLEVSKVIDLETACERRVWISG